MGAQTETKHSIDHPFTEPGSYFVTASALINDRKLVSNTVTIEVPKPEVPSQEVSNPPAATGPTLAHLSTPGSPKKSKTPSTQPVTDVLAEHNNNKEVEHQATPTPTPTPTPNQPIQVDWRAALRLAIIVILILATLGAAYFLHKWRTKAKAKQLQQPTSM